MDGNQEYWKQVCGFLKSCKNLCRIEVIVWCNDVCHQVRGRDIDEKIDRLFEMIRDTRSADGDVFSDVTTIRQGTTLVPLYRTRQITGIVPSGGRSTFKSVEETPEFGIAPRALLESNSKLLP